MGIEVRRFTWDYLDSNMYVIRSGDDSLVIDPVDNDAAFGYLKCSTNITVLLTHEHFDHICGLNRLRAEHNCSVVAQDKCSDRIQNSGTNFSAMAEIMMELSGNERCKRIEPFACDKADITFDDKYVLNWVNTDIEIFSTPGHSPGSACIRLNRYLFTGDSLLKRGPMNRFPGGSKRDYYQRTIPFVQRWIEKTDIVFPGHGEEFTAREIDWI